MLDVSLTPPATYGHFSPLVYPGERGGEHPRINRRAVLMNMQFLFMSFLFALQCSCTYMTFSFSSRNALDGNCCFIS